MKRYKVSVFRTTRRGGVIARRTLAETFVPTKEDAIAQLRAWKEEYTCCSIDITLVP